MRQPSIKLPKLIEIISQRPHCFAVKGMFTNGKVAWQDTHVCFGTKPDEVCPRCKEKEV